MEIDLSQMLKKGTGKSLVKDNCEINREENHIYFYTEVERESSKELIDMIKEAEDFCLKTKRSTNVKNMYIYLHINSFGGCIFSAFNVIDYMECCKIPIHTIIEGSTASAGTLISIFGKKRYIRPNAYMLIHELSSECWGKMNEIEEQYKHLKSMMVKIKGMYEKKTSIPKRTLSQILKKDIWLESEKCLEYGLVQYYWKE